MMAMLSIVVSAIFVLLSLCVECTIAHEGVNYHHHHLRHSPVLEGHRQIVEQFTKKNGGMALPPLIHKAAHSGHAHCGTPERTAEQKAYSDKLVSEWKSRKDLGQARQSPITFPVCFHVIRPTNDDDPDFLNATMLQENLDHLNLAFSSASCCDTTQSWCQENTCSIETGIRFEMALLSTDGTFLLPGTTPQVSDASACVTRTQNDVWYTAGISSNEEKLMMKELRLGDSGVLNVFVNDLRDEYGLNETLLGFAQIPEVALLNSETDGIVLVNNALTELKFRDTLPHEAGHWLGLPHTFDDFSGGSCEVGDEIQDTPAEKLSARGCNPLRDTCPAEGLDPVHNFMDYSNDECQYEFTSGQRSRIMAEIEAYRLNVALNSDIVLQDGVPSSPINLIPGEPQMYKLEANGTSFVQCFASSDLGIDAIYYLYMRVDDKPDMTFSNFDCDSIGYGHCAVTTYSNATVWVLLSPYGNPLEDIVVTCTAMEPASPSFLPYGVASDPISLEVDELKMYQLPVEPENTFITCQLTGDNGDPDIYARFNSQLYSVNTFIPVFDGASFTEFSNERLIVQVPSGVNATFVGVQASQRFDNASLTCYSTQPRPIVALEDGLKSDPISLGRSELQYFTLDVEREAVGVQCNASAASGDGILLLNWGSEPDFNPFYSSYACRTESFDTPCTASYAGSGDYFLYVPVLYVMIDAREPLEDLEVTCKKIYPEAKDLINGVASDPMDLMVRDDQLFRLNVTPGSNVTCETDAEDGGDVDLYLRFNEPLQITRLSRASCSSETTSSEEACVVDIPSDTSLLYVTLKPFGGNVSGATVLCTENASERTLSSSTSLIQLWFATFLMLSNLFVVLRSFCS